MWERCGLGHHVVLPNHMVLPVPSCCPCLWNLLVVELFLTQAELSIQDMFEVEAEADATFAVGQRQ